MLSDIKLAKFWRNNDYKTGEKRQKDKKPHFHAATCTFSKELPKDPAVLQILRDSELLRRSVLLCPPYALCSEPLFEGKMPAKPRKMVSAQGGRQRKSVCDSKFTTHSKFTTA